MNPSPTPDSDTKSRHTLLLAWAICASVAAVGLLTFTIIQHPSRSVASTSPMRSNLPALPAEVYRTEGFGYHHQGRKASAIATFEECIREYPDYAEAYHGLAMAQRDAGDPGLAMHNHDRAIELAPGRWDYYWERGATCQRLNMHDAAITNFEMGLEQDNRQGNLHIGLAQSYRAKGDPETALLHNEDALALNANSDWFYRERGLTYQALGNRERAEDDFLKARELKAIRPR